MLKCAAPGCPGTRTKDSAFCLAHAIEAGGWFYLANTLQTDLDPESIERPEPVTPPPSVWEGIAAKIQQESEAAS